MTYNCQPVDPEIDFSILITCYFEEQSIHEFYARLSATLQSMKRRYEIIFVNDASTDRTFEILKEIFDKDPNVSSIIDLYKNAGQANAATPAILLARGKAMVLIDSDLQLDPEDLPMLIRKYDKGYDIVSGYRKNRQDPIFRKLASIVANMIMRKASASNFRDFGCTYKIYDSCLVRAFEFNAFNPWRPLPVIAHARRIEDVPVNHHPRKYGKSGWTFQKLFSYNMENLVNLSKQPFQITGALCLFFALLFVVRIIISYVFPFSILPTITSGLILNVILVCFLILLSILCAIGEFVIRNFIILQNRPSYIIRKIFMKDKSNFHQFDQFINTHKYCMRIGNE
jgi:glycosyltransferase involved in cell wall biosynthesis